MSVNTSEQQLMPSLGRRDGDSTSDGLHINQTYIRRVMRDLKEFYSNNMQNIEVIAEEDNISIVHALIHGPESTPYANGFFYFKVIFPPNYPISPPNVRLLTTDGMKVRFNPNLYKCGKVCLSILGTWSGPAWTAANTLLTVLLSIQSLMNEKPFHNEPGFEENNRTNKASAHFKEQALTYNEIITHETIRVAVIGMIEENSCDTRNMPQVMKDMMISSFIKNYKYFEDLVESKLAMTGKTMSDPFNEKRGIFQYQTLLNKLQELKIKLNIGEDNTTHIQNLIKPYLEIATKYSVIETRPPPLVGDQTDEWEDIINDINKEDMEEDFDLEYSEEEDEN